MVVEVGSVVELGEQGVVEEDCPVVVDPGVVVELILSNAIFVPIVKWFLYGYDFINIWEFI